MSKNHLNISTDSHILFFGQRIERERLTEVFKKAVNLDRKSDGASQAFIEGFKFKKALDDTKMVELDGQASLRDILLSSSDENIFLGQYYIGDQYIGKCSENSELPIPKDTVFFDFVSGLVSVFMLKTIDYIDNNNPYASVTIIKPINENKEFYELFLTGGRHSNEWFKIEFNCSPHDLFENIVRCGGLNLPNTPVSFRLTRQNTKPGYIR